MSSYSGIVETQSVANKQVEDEVPDPAGDDEWFTLLDEEIDEFKRAIKAVPPKSKYPHLSQEEYNQLPGEHVLLYSPSNTTHSWLTFTPLQKCASLKKNF